MTVSYHPSVQRDVSRVLRRYDAVSNRLADEFWDELQSVLRTAAANPLRFHPYVEDLRRANLKRFPYHFLYRVLPGKIRVIAVRHHKQEPRTGTTRR